MKLTRRLFALSTLAVAALAAGHAHAQSGQTVKIAWLDPLSGMLANIGQNSLKTFQYMAEKVSADNPAGVKFEIVSFDNKLSPQESLTALKAATDQGIRYVTQGNGSSVAGALIDAINKHNARNPGKEIVFLNNAAVDPDFTNSKCSFWHFRFDADTSMKMEALTSYLKDEKNVKKVYLINQNYSHGHQVAKFFKEALARKRPDVQVVGEDLHPLAQVKDFAPYVAKIKASGADSIVTGNWGSDLSLLIKAAKDAGLDANWYTYYGGANGSPSAIGPTMDGKVKFVYIGHSNIPALAPWMKEYRQRFNDDLSLLSTVHVLPMLAQAMAQAKSTDPVKVAQALSGLSVKSFSGEVTMRRQDHQLQQPLYIATWRKITDPGKQYNVEGTGFTWVQERVFEPYVSSTPTSCQMKRPG
ncbi:MAG TPA: branched-chain amino acid ABC transporter substrate-binding protein [Rubrivivax sp.]|jgi:branched-chain amino acid transport system substrate-binding protein|nr:branched-chain amino acid ABC transporter substrate-binding protein [Rhodoferax sp.]MCL4737345.1 branched-chain amino acid ABC transporter substrate-binding protein [Burkholderiaceae bacterium]MCP5288908.1 branched-chain amino acid ABC transporter substrate-binding protein [Burkholderiaceae bacterium]HMQ71943.1 branched-chain amino acid ABC transporter substrate-binding protein [Rubrivivax sp.]HMR69427.1 branched-chain amino acid ABC transporter substrate-binding protein [Rubrivivax sp.]